MRSPATRLCRSLAAAAVLALGAPPAGAEPGVLEINHACATTSGCFPGDAGGYPVTIDGASGRSFRLTSDLAIPSATTAAISIQASHVSIDLGGFRIQGLNACSGTPTTCTFQNVTGFGVAVDDQLLRKGISVRNGVIAGMGSNAVLLGDHAIVRDLRVSESAGGGIVAGSGSVVAANVVDRCQITGIHIGMTGSIAVGNNVARSGSHGIFAGVAALVEDNVVTENGGNGISISAGSRAIDNVVRANALTGLTTAANSTYTGNTITANVGDQVSGGGQDLGGNFCNGTGTTAPDCP